MYDVDFIRGMFNKSFSLNLLQFYNCLWLTRNVVLYLFVGQTIVQGDMLDLGSVLQRIVNLRFTFSYLNYQAESCKKIHQILST